MVVGIVDRAKAAVLGSAGHSVAVMRECEITFDSLSVGGGSGRTKGWMHHNNGAYRAQTRAAEYEPVHEVTLVKPKGKALGLTLADDWDRLTLDPGSPLTFPQVTNLTPGSPAEAAGVLMGDRLVSVSGRGVLGGEKDAIRRLSAARAGSTLRLGLLRPAVVQQAVARSLEDLGGAMGGCSSAEEFMARQEERELELALELSMAEAHGSAMPAHATGGPSRGGAASSSAGASSSS